MVANSLYGKTEVILKSLRKGQLVGGGYRVPDSSRGFICCESNSRINRPWSVIESVCLTNFSISTLSYQPSPHLPLYQKNKH